MEPRNGALPWSIATQCLHTGLLSYAPAELNRFRARLRRSSEIHAALRLVKIGVREQAGTKKGAAVGVCEQRLRSGTERPQGRPSYSVPGAEAAGREQLAPPALAGGR